ncbi:MAG: PulJ/GspJ family protein [Bacillota bacterium]
MKFCQSLLGSEDGFTLLELVMVVALVGMLATALSGTIISQYQMWEFNTNQTQTFENSELFISYLERDISQAIDYEVVSETELELELDKDRDGDSEVTRNYMEQVPEKYKNLITEIKFTETEDGLIEVKITLESGDFKHQTTRFFHIGAVNYTTN